MNSTILYVKYYESDSKFNLGYYRAWLDGEKHAEIGFSKSSAVGKLILFYAKNVTLTITKVIEE